MPDLPVYQIIGCKDATGNTVTYVTSEPDKALVSRLCADVSRTKVPSLQEVVSFYNARFNMRLSAAQQDLVNFLGAL